MSIYYKYAPYGTKIVVLSYVDDCLYWYTYEAPGKWFVDTLGKSLHMNFLVYAHWFMSIVISQMKYHSISVDQASSIWTRSPKFTGSVFKTPVGHIMIVQDLFVKKSRK